jgi:MerR family transcriptional regulator, Zn(II)-responsive regulator of zntA
MFQVGEVSKALGLNSQTLYFYERIGLIPSPQRTESGYRLFSQHDIDRLAFIVRVKSLGLSLDEIKDILALQDGRSLTCQAVYERLNKKVQDIERTIQSLQALHDELTPLVEQCYSKLQLPDRECVVLDRANSLFNDHAMCDFLEWRKYSPHPDPLPQERKSETLQSPSPVGEGLG